MSETLESALMARWWWNPANPAAPKLESRNGRGKVQKSFWPAGWTEDLEPAAFTYELLARLSWYYALKVGSIPYPPADLYPFGKSFADLTRLERHDVQDQFEHTDCILSPKYPSLWEVEDDEPTMGYIRLRACEFDPEHTSVKDALKAIEKRIREAAQQQGITLLEGSKGRRNNPFAWETLELSDRLLAGQKLAAAWQKTHLLLTRHLNLWAQWYLLKNDPQVWKRADGQGYWLTIQQGKQ